MDDVTGPMTFNNGLSPDQDDELDNMIIAVGRLIIEVEGLGRHRSYSLAVTKLEEAKHWLRDRKSKPA
jgi:hypothetical protein